MIFLIRLIIICTIFSMPSVLAVTTITSTTITMLKNYKRPFTMVEFQVIAQHALHFLLRLLFSSSVFIIIGSNEKLLATLIDKNLQNCILLKCIPTMWDLHRFSECEHIDFIIAPLILKKSCLDIYIDELSRLGDHLLVHIFNISMKPTLAAKAIHIDGTRNLFLFDNPKKIFVGKTWIKQLRSPIKIHSTYTEKKLIKTRPHDNVIVVADWKPGISLITFKMFFGAYPTVPMLKQELDRLKYVKHSDWGAHNMIVQGVKLNLIDQSIRHEGHSLNDKRERKYSMLNEWVSLQENRDIEAYYFERIKAKPCDMKHDKHDQA